MKKISGTVINGNKIGGKLLFKTANILYDLKKVEDGVYKVNVIFGGSKYKGIGATVERKGVFETHLFDFKEDLYNKKIDIYLLEKIRDNLKFEKFDDLKSQIQNDIIYAKKNTIKVMTFGTFDIVHPGHIYYLKNASFYGDKLITIIARDKNVKNFKDKLPLNDENKRLENIKKLGISDVVELGNLENPFVGIENFSPQIICLGYDQEGFYKELKNNNNFLDIKIIRLKSYKPEIYKSSKLREKIDNKN